MMRLKYFICLCAFWNSCFSDEQSCSKFDFEEKLLAKMVTMERDFEDLQKTVNTVHSYVEDALKSAEAQMESVETKTETNLADFAARVTALESEYNYTSLMARKLAELGISFNSTFCPDGWTYFQNSCYFFGREKLQFDDAQKYCETSNADLVNIEDAKENDFLRAQLKELKAPQHWIGMTDLKREGDWKHYPSQTDVTYFDWGKHQPNNGRVSNCVAFWESFQYLWVDEPCTRSFRPICEKKFVNN